MFGVWRLSCGLWGCYRLTFRCCCLFRVFLRFRSGYFFSSVIGIVFSRTEGKFFVVFLGKRVGFRAKLRIL